VQRAAVRDLQFAIDDLTDDGVAGNPEKQVFGIPLHGRELAQPSIQIGQVEACGMELLFKPQIESDGADDSDIAGSRSEGEAIQGVQNACVALQLS
jgi:hypothetical protein